MWKFGSLVFPPNREGLFIKERLCLRAGSATASHSALLFPVLCSSAPAFWAQLWVLWGLCQCPGGQMSPLRWFSTTASVCYQFFGGEPRSLDDRSESLSPLLLQNLFSKERSYRNNRKKELTGVAAWPLKKPFLSIHLIKNRRGCGVSIVCSL